MVHEHGRTGLSPGDYKEALGKVVAHLGKNDSVNNRTLRSITGLNYDQAIKFFNLAVANGVLVRQGKAAGIHYVLPRLERQ